MMFVLNEKLVFRGKDPETAHRILVAGFDAQARHMYVKSDLLGQHVLLQM
jgi:hypothetical protein